MFIVELIIIAAVRTRAKAHTQGMISNRKARFCPVIRPEIIPLKIELTNLTEFEQAEPARTTILYSLFTHTNGDCNVVLPVCVIKRSAKRTNEGQLGVRVMKFAIGQAQVHL